MLKMKNTKSFSCNNQNNRLSHSYPNNVANNPKLISVLMAFVQCLKEVSTLLLNSPALPVTYKVKPKPVKFYCQKRF